jgi:hypothetical protein
MTNVWEVEEMPKDSEEGIICPLFKKGVISNCANYRGITSLNISYKMLSNILREQIRSYAERIIGNYQRGFRTERSTSNQLHVLRQMLEKNNRVQHLYFPFIY